jgi:hypothetical protein
LHVIVVILVAEKGFVVNASATIGAEMNYPLVFSLILLNGLMTGAGRILFRCAKEKKDNSNTSFLTRCPDDYDSVLVDYSTEKEKPKTPFFR